MVSEADHPDSSLASANPMASPRSSTNPFLDPPTSVAVSAATIQMTNIRQHVHVILDLQKSNYPQWRTLFMTTFRKYGICDHIDGTVDAQQRFFNHEWVQIDYCIVAWLYNTVSAEILDIILKPDDTAFSVWTAIRSLFLDNRAQRAVYAQQEFYSLFQGETTISQYFSRLKQLADTMRDVGHPVTEQQLVLNMIRGLHPDYAQALSNLTIDDLPTFLKACSHLEQVERQRAHTATMEAATAYQ